MRLLLTFLLCLMAIPAGAQTTALPDVQIRAYFESEDDVYVGQLARLWIEVSTDTWFTTAPSYPELRLDGAIVLLPEQLGVNFSEAKAGKTRTGQRQRYVVMPQRPGTLSVPALSVTLAVSVDGKPSEPITVRTQPVSAAVVYPAGAENIRNLVVVEEIRVHERYDGNGEGLRAGDGITRRVTMDASDTFALALPPVSFGKVTGARIYAGQPDLQDKVNRGQYQAKRTDSATYVFEREGTFEFPEVSVKWWNPEIKAVEEKLLPSMEVKVSAGPAGPAGTTQPDGVPNLSNKLKDWLAAGLSWLRENIRSVTLFTIGAYLIVLAARRFMPVIKQRWDDGQTRYKNSEWRACRKLRAACRLGNEQDIVNSFWHWAEHFSDADEVPTLKRLAQQAGDSDFVVLSKLLERSGCSNSETLKSDLDLLSREISNLRRLLIIARTLQHAGLQLTMNPRSSHP